MTVHYFNLLLLLKAVACFLKLSYQKTNFRFCNLYDNLTKNIHQQNNTRCRVLHFVAKIISAGFIFLRRILFAENSKNLKNFCFFRKKPLTSSLW